MVCIYCRSKTKVTNSRSQARQPGTWRRRQCLVCVAQFTTIEAPDYGSSLSVRHDKKRLDPFSRDTLFLSLHKALGHRSTALTDAGSLAATVTAKLLKSPRIVDGILTKQQIAATIYETLRRFDALAATTYKAYHQPSLSK